MTERKEKRSAYQAEYTEDSEDSEVNDSEAMKELIRGKVKYFYGGMCEHCGRGEIMFKTDKGIVFCSVCEN